MTTELAVRHRGSWRDMPLDVPIVRSRGRTALTYRQSAVFTLAIGIFQILVLRRHHPRPPRTPQPRLISKNHRGQHGETFLLNP